VAITEKADDQRLIEMRTMSESAVVDGPNFKFLLIRMILALEYITFSPNPLFCFLNQLDSQSRDVNAILHMFAQIITGDLDYLD
jgi:hypothetical protein